MVYSSLNKALIIGIQSYVDKLIINIGVDVDVIPDPHHRSSPHDEFCCSKKDFSCVKGLSETFGVEKMKNGA